MRILFLLLVAAGLLAQTQQPSPKPAETSEESDAPEVDLDLQLAKVRRVYVDMLSGGDSAIKIRDLLMSSLRAAKLFIITEEEEKADAVLKGAGEDTVFTDSFQSSDGINAHSQMSLPDLQPATPNSTSRYSTRGSASMSIGENENRRTEERKHEAIATVRLVAKDGDVLWSTTQESFGGKFMGAAADVADKVSKRLAADVRRARGTGRPSAK